MAKQPSKGVVAYRELRKRIVSGVLPPGSRLQQYDLADELEMSITPLREAIRQLASEGWIHMETHRDARVAETSDDEARELLEVRYALEPLAAELAAMRRTDADLIEIRSTAKALLPVTLDTSEEAFHAHRAFHTSIFKAAHNTVLLGSLEDVWDKSDRYRRLSTNYPADDGARAVDFAQHHRLAKLIEEGDGPAAAELSREHIRNSLSAIRTGALSGSLDNNGAFKFGAH
ncbi:GntR family transcriptional regulator [Corynebacterium epidermidicanis]|uniref:Transcriptional regulator n=1 Tax=Corynebacterium epidermidicanis TaxID=1050174 RepID=A0A0G3GMB0_9CORY|nr:GntR family transcriptional regulator [Corynebacterium epidermidicanis]AKK02279.1 transcriptional regulator [Corynebacterium epidermidicanis]